MSDKLGMDIWSASDALSFIRRTTVAADSESRLIIIRRAFLAAELGVRRTDTRKRELLKKVSVQCN